MSFYRSQVSAPAAWQTEVRAGFVATLPLWLGVAPFAAIYAVSALAACLSHTQTLAMSILVFGGAAQFTSLGLFAAGAAPLAIVLMTLIVNARHLLLGASLARYVVEKPRWQRTLVALHLTDESYAVGVRRFLKGNSTLAYQFGSNISLYLIWQISTIAGMLLGALVPNPAAYGLELFFPLTFVGLLMPVLRERVRAGERRALLVAGCAAVLAVAGALLLAGTWYLLLAGVGASALGALVPRAGSGKLHDEQASIAERSAEY
jgi:4-azaleucine resistance transporter AzlC